MLLVAVGGAWAAAQGPELSRAIAEQNELIEQSPEEPSLWNDLGNLLTLNGQRDAARVAYERALVLDPEDVVAHYNLALLIHAEGGDSEALEHYRHAVALEPAHAWSYFQMGRIYESQGDREAAIDAYARAFALEPQLSFSDVNPYVIDSRLITEALLRANRKTLVDWAPRRYADPARIARILTPKGSETAGEETAGEEPVEPSPSAGEESSIGEDKGESQEAPPTRKLTVDDLSGLPNVNQVTPGASGRPGYRGGQRPVRPQTRGRSRVVDPDEDEPSAPSEPASRSYFRPGLRSSAQVVPKLIPSLPAG